MGAMGFGFGGSNKGGGGSSSPTASFTLPAGQFIGITGSGSTLGTAGAIRLGQDGQIVFQRNGGSNILGVWMDTTTSLAVGSGNATNITVSSGGPVTLAPAAGGAMITGGIVQGSGASGDEYRYKVATQAMADANQSLSAANGAAEVIQTTGAITATRTLTLAATLGQVRDVDNQCTGAFAIKIAPATGDLNANGIANGKTARVYCDGTNWRRLTADATP